MEMVMQSQGMMELEYDEIVFVNGGVDVKRLAAGAAGTIGYAAAKSGAEATWDAVASIFK